MTKAELIKAAAKRAGVKQETAAEIISAALEIAAEAITSGEAVKVQRFGALEIKERGARTTYNFKTGEQMKVAAHKIIVFTPADDLKDRMNG